MGITEMLADLKNHLEHGAELVASHLPALAEWAKRAEADPLVQAAVDLVVPEGTRVMLAGLLKTVEAEVARVAAEAQARAQEAAPAGETPAGEAGESAAAEAAEPQVIPVPGA